MATSWIPRQCCTDRSDMLAVLVGDRSERGRGPAGSCDGCLIEQGSPTLATKLVRPPSQTAESDDHQRGGHQQQGRLVKPTQARPGTARNRTPPTAQIRHTLACTPATNVPSASRIIIANEFALAAGLGWKALWYRPDAALLLLLQRVARRIPLVAHIARRILVCERVASLIPRTADGILHLAGCPLSGAIGLELCIANDFCRDLPSPPP
jgi:hypothetical protein